MTPTYQLTNSVQPAFSGHSIAFLPTQLLWVELRPPPQRYVEVLTLGQAPEPGEIENKVFVYLVKMRSLG